MSSEVTSHERQRIRMDMPDLAVEENGSEVAYAVYEFHQGLHHLKNVLRLPILSLIFGGCSRLIDLVEP